ncbi:hypothetical protein BCR35DRAFT_304110 [Leucosporidium creatinivorum]|uniref:SGNH hydrolase-type esterase domain-containing protein n=1 Tax=Leucosporidium creatinivorum TaxID=106004 RepID=A0A1Y2FD67_9BASI|nr:hypothetical protein BCR35DRAFT_304110 [Leucosporidium creatinivorum]
MVQRRSALIAGAISSLFFLLLVFRPPAPTATPRNVQLQSQLVQRLINGEALTLGILGGSISRQEGGYGAQVVDWLNRNWPSKEGAHSLVNGAVAASESSLASVCFDTLLQQDGSSPNLNLIIVEYSYNDAASPETARSAFEAITRQALLRNSAVFSLEFAGYSHNRGHMEIGKATNDFQNSVGTLHADVASLYSVPIVDVARYFYAFADAERLMNYTDGIHPNLEGHGLVATLVVEELIRLVASTEESAQWFLSKSISVNGPSWLHPPPPTPPSDNARSLPSLPSPFYRSSASSVSAELSPLPPPSFSSTSPSSDIIKWSCTISQISSTVSALRQSAIEMQGFLYGHDESDGGPFRSRARPGFRTNSTMGEGDDEEGHLIFALGRSADVKSVALLYRRSWQASGKAVVWVDQERETGRGRSRSGGCEREVDGQWEAETTQMVLEVVCEEGAVEWREEGELFLHVVARRRDYFKVYGYAKG